MATAELHPSQRRRTACDRCHSQKLRCSKSTGNRSCDRCLKLSTECLFSPSMRGSRPTSQILGRRTFAELSSDDNGLDMGMGMEGVELDAGVDPGQIENDSFNSMLVDWTSIPKSPGLQDAGHGFDGFFLGDGDLALSDDFLQNTMTPNYMLDPLLQNEKINHDQDTPIFTESSTPRNQNDNVPAESDLPGLDQRTISTNSSAGPGQSPKNIQEEDGPKPDRVPAFTAAREVQVSVNRQLADFSATLAEHVSTIPPMNIHHDTHICSSSAEENTNEPSALLGKSPRCIVCYGDGVFLIEETFQHTETLVNLYSRLVADVIQLEGPREWWRMYLPTRNDQSPKVLDAEIRATRDADISNPISDSSVDNGSSPQASLASHKTASRPSLDHASVYLMLSCHHRLIDIWEAVFSHLQVRIDKDFAVGRTTDIDGRCAKIKIGSYAPSAASTASIYMTLIVELSERLLDQAKKVAEEISSESTERSGNARAGSGVAERSQKVIQAQHDATAMACRAMTERARVMLDQITRLRERTLSISQSAAVSTT